MMNMLLYSMVFLFFLMGLFAVLAKRNLLKMIMGLTFMEYSICLFFVLTGYRWDGHVPVIRKGAEGWVYVDPLSQAMAVAAIILGLSVLSLFVATALRLYEKFGSFGSSDITGLKG